MTTRIKRCFPATLFLYVWTAWSLLLAHHEPSLVNALSLSTKSTKSDRKNFVILGGTGKIGTAVAIHLLQRDPTCHLTLVGRRPNDAARKEVLEQSGVSENNRISMATVPTVWDKACQELQALVQSADCLIHAAGPYLDQKPVPLELALESKKCRVYVDISDPLTYLETSLLMSEEAESKGLTALVAAGAFPGMSNVLAKEAAQALAPSGIQDVRFQYFTAGLGGSGVVNLYITNLGFGEAMVQYDLGNLRWFLALSGKLLGKVNFFLPQLQNHKGNELVKQRVGSKTIFAWPFPEAATVAKDVGALGNSYAGMGTAPDLWNDMLGLLVQLVPRPWWKSKRFSKFLADFSEPLVLATDAMMQKMGTGETHAMRIDVTSVPPAFQKDGGKGMTIIQAHDSFRICVGQSCAEFALDALSNPNPGVYLPEQFYDDPSDRSRIIENLTSTPGTFCYTGPVAMENTLELPSDWEKAIFEANAEEQACISK